MQKTANYNLNKPEQGEFYNIDEFNENADLIDAKLKEFEDGTTPVGNADKLGGKEASDYARSETLNTSILEKALTLSKGTYHFGLGGNNYIGNDLPHASYVYGSAMVEVQSASAITVIVWGTAYGNTPVILQYYNGSSWRNDWVALATTADLANYLPLSGGTIESHLVTPFHIKSTADDSRICIGFWTKGVKQGSLGFNGVNIPVFVDNDGSPKTLLHRGNKPSGSYTGNGDATSRTINTSGIGSVVQIWGNGTSVLITEDGGRKKSSTTLSGLSYYECTFKSGVLTLATTDTSLNASGVTYYYQVL